MLQQSGSTSYFHEAAFVDVQVYGSQEQIACIFGKILSLLFHRKA